jgi:hypothetical protein
MIVNGYSKIRACELKKGDIYVKQQVTYRVTGIKGGKIYYCPNTSKGGRGEIGANSQEWVLRVANENSAKKPKRHKIIAHKNGHVYGKYSTLAEARRETGICESSIAEYLKGWRPRKPYPYHFTKA